MFLQMASREICFGGEICVKSSGFGSSSTSTISQNIFGVLHLIVSLGIILVIMPFFGMFCIFSILIIIDSTVPAAVTSLMNFFQLALLFIQRWLPLFYVPSLVVLPLSIRDISAAAGIKIGFITAQGWLATLCVVGFTTIAIRTFVKTEMVDAEPMAKSSPFSTIELWSWSGILLISFVGALFYPILLGTSAQTCLPFLLASTVLGYIVGTRKHFIVLSFTSHFLYVQVPFSKVSKKLLNEGFIQPWSGDVLMGFLGSVILSFAFSMFKQRKLVKRHAVEIFTSVIASTLFSLYSTALIGCLVGLEPSLTVSILPRCIIVSLALSIVSLFEARKVVSFLLQPSLVIVVGSSSNSFTISLSDPFFFDVANLILEWSNGETKGRTLAIYPYYYVTWTYISYLCCIFWILCVKLLLNLQCVNIL
ncbi:hypothetical protein UlMin_011342 [Ulmus minor]